MRGREVAGVVQTSEVERIELRFSDDPTARFQQLRAGPYPVDTLTHDQFLELGSDATFRANCWRTYYFLPQWAFCAWNLKDPDDPDLERPHPVLSDVRVRQALSMLFPREKIRDEHLHGLAKIVTGPWFFKDADYDRTVPAVPYDVAEAQRLLTAAGYRLDADGFLRKGDRPLRFTLTTLQGAGWLDSVAQSFVESARKCVRYSAWSAVSSVSPTPSAFRCRRATSSSRCLGST